MKVAGLPTWTSFHSPDDRRAALAILQSAVIITVMLPAADQTQELLAHARDGDSEAVNQLMERHRESLRQIVRLRLDQKIQRRVDVSDVVQDVLIEANRRLPDYLANPLMSFRLWLRQIARDRIIDAHRRHRASARRSVDREQNLAVPRGADQSSLELAALLGDQEMTPSEKIIQDEMLRRVEQAIGHLDQHDAEIIVMRHYEQFSNQEIAQALGLTEPAASMRYLRAIRRLKAQLQDDHTHGSRGEA